MMVSVLQTVPVAGPPILLVIDVARFAMVLFNRSRLVVLMAQFPLSKSPVRAKNKAFTPLMRSLLGDKALSRSGSQT